MLLEAFDKLPASSKYVHMLSLWLMGQSVILLMTPAAYHRIVDRGEDSERFHRVVWGSLRGGAKSDAVYRKRYREFGDDAYLFLRTLVWRHHLPQITTAKIVDDAREEEACHKRAGCVLR
jgi:hypothetical protein